MRRSTAALTLRPSCSGTHPACPASRPPCAGVAARVLKVDRSVGRLSLGLKPSYFEGLDPAQLRGEGSDEEEDFDAEVEAALAAEVG